MLAQAGRGNRSWEADTELALEEGEGLRSCFQGLSGGGGELVMQDRLSLGYGPEVGEVWDSKKQGLGRNEGRERWPHDRGKE